jgi:hypothetical protein
VVGFLKDRFRHMHLINKWGESQNFGSICKLPLTNDCPGSRSGLVLSSMQKQLLSNPPIDPLFGQLAFPPPPHPPNARSIPVKAESRALAFRAPKCGITLACSRKWCGMPYQLNICLPVHQLLHQGPCLLTRTEWPGSRHAVISRFPVRLWFRLLPCEKIWR